MASSVTCFLVILLITTEAKLHQCTHNTIVSRQTLIGRNVNYIGGDRRRLSLTESNTYQSIRITPYWDYLESDFGSNPSNAIKLQYIKQIISTAIRYFESFIKINRISSELYLPLLCTRYSMMHGIKNCIEYKNSDSYKCGDVPIPESFLESNWIYNPLNESAEFITSGNGIINTDYVLFVSAGECNNTQEILGYASSCHIDEFGRPISGHIRFCHGSLQKLYWKYDVITTIHELTHAFIMSPNLWKHFRYKNGTKMPINNVIQRQNNRTWIITDNVKKVAQKHFNCDKLIGLPLEDDGDIDNVGSHWNELYINYEYMGAVLYSAMDAVSIFTLALMQDSGWYELGEDLYEIADSQYNWGKDKGCDFFESKCIEDEYCNNKYDDGCSFNYVAPSYCNLNQDINTKDDIEYFSDRRGIEESKFNEYCPFRIPKINQMNEYESFCMDIVGGNRFDGNLKEQFGVRYTQNSRCTNIVDEIGNKYGLCYIYECYGYDVMLNRWNSVKITYFDRNGMNKTVVCNRNDVNKRNYIKEYRFNILCPSIDIICIGSKPFNCFYGHYSDKYSKCICHPGYKGIDCNEKDIEPIIQSVILGEIKSTTSPTHSPADIVTGIHLNHEKNAEVGDEENKEMDWRETADEYIDELNGNPETFRIVVMILIILFIIFNICCLCISLWICTIQKSTKTRDRYTDKRKFVKIPISKNNHNNNNNKEMMEIKQENTNSNVIKYGENEKRKLFANTAIRQKWKDKHIKKRVDIAQYDL